MKEINRPLAPLYRAAVNRLKSSNPIDRILTASGTLLGLGFFRRLRDSVTKPNGTDLREYAESVGVKIDATPGKTEGTLTFTLVEFALINGQVPTTPLEMVAEDVPAERQPEAAARASGLAEGYNLALQHIASLHDSHVDRVKSFVRSRIRDLFQTRKAEQAAVRIVPAASSAAAADAIEVDGVSIVDLEQPAT